MSYARYLRSLIIYRHPRLSYFDTFTPAYTRAIVKNNAYIVYSIFAVFGLIEIRNYRCALAARRKAIEIPK